MNPAPFLEVITAREAVADLAADQLREQISALSQQLTALGSSARPAFSRA